MRISDWSSDVCSSDLGRLEARATSRQRCRDSGAVLLPPPPDPADSIEPRPTPGRRLLCGTFPVLLGGRPVPAPTKGAAVPANPELGARFPCLVRSDERRVGKGCFRPCKYRWSPYP